MRKLHLPFLVAIFISSFFSLKSQSNLWGVTTNGGNGAGSLFGLPTGATAFSSQYNFTDFAGSGVTFNKMLESNGKMYGMTTLGGANSQGLIFEYDPVTNIYTKKIEFSLATGAGILLGSQPNGGLIKASSNGKMYGMTKVGGANNLGTIFEYEPLTNTISVVAAFTGTTGAAMGGQPIGSLLEGSNGKLYGVTSRGGNGTTGNGSGVIFEFTPGANTYSVLASFTGATGLVQGSASQCTLIENALGKFQGVTLTGGVNNVGVLFEYDLNTFTYTKLYDFAAATGSSPNGALLKASNGKFYGTTAAGGVNSAGVVFEYDPVSTIYTAVSSLIAANGTPAYCTLIQGTNGKLYGTTRTGGASNLGAIFEYDFVAGTYTKKQDLTAATGDLPQTSLASFSGNGKLYGLTPQGGASSGGVIFEYDYNTNTYTKKIDLNNSTGGQPNGAPVLASNNKLYGVAASGGVANSGGVIYEFDQTTNTYVRKVELVAANGRFGYGALIQAGNGTLYGLMSAGGTGSVGTLISYVAGGTSYTKLFDFTVANGNTPYGAVVQYTNGNLYGVTSAGGTNGVGVVFEYNITTATYTNKFNLATATGANPFGSLYIASNGKAYGMTSAGGANGLGVIFEYDIIANTYTKKIDLTAANGSMPYGSLVQANGNLLYGMTRQGGANGLGVIFEYDFIANTYTKKMDLTAANGSSPYGSLTKAANGKLYGLTTAGGANGVGVMFEYDPVAVTYTKKMDLSTTTGGAPGYTQLLEICTLPTAAGAITGTNTLCMSDASVKNYSIATIANATSYTWTVPSGASVTGGTTNNLNVNFGSVAAGVYTVSGGGVNVCGTGTLSAQVVTINALPSLTVNSGAICSGSTFTIVPSGASSYTIQGGSANVSPATSTNYTVTGTNSNGCVSAAFVTSSVTVNTSPTILVNSGAICSGGSFTISPTGASSYTIQGGSAVVSPGSTTTYTVSGTAGNGCTSTGVATSTVTVNNRPTIAVASGSICSGNSFSISPSGASTYTVSGNSFNVSPSANTDYTVTGASAAGCPALNTVVATVSVFTTPTVGVNSGTVCSGRPFTITPTGVSSYTITGGSNIVSPTTNTIYMVTGSSAAGCVALNTATSTIGVTANPFVTATSGTICSGGSFSISPGGSNGTYTITGGTFVVSPATTTSYSLTGTNSAGCVSSNTAVSTVTVYTTPTMSVSPGTICSGKSFTFSPTGVTTSTVSGGSNVVSPGVTTSYTVTGSSAQGCQATPVVLTITVLASPTITAASGTICAGGSFSITQIGANATYTVSGGSALVSPAVTTTYAVVGSNSNGCTSNTVTSTVLVNANPTISVNSGSICAGGQFTITPSGATNYTVTGNNFTVSPATSTNYTVTGSSAAGCAAVGPVTSSVTVQALPVISISSQSAVCSGSTATLIASGGVTYTWTPSSLTSATLLVTPSATITYSVVGANASGCSSMASTTVIVNPLPVVNVASGAVCPGQSFTLSPSGAVTYTYSGGGTAIVTPASTTDYTVTGTDANGCVSLGAVASITVTSQLPVVISGLSSVCSGSAAVLTAGGASTYSWNTGANTATIEVFPTSTTMYTVTGSSGSCSNTATVSVNALPLPTVVAVSSQPTICIGQTATLSASGADSYTWSTGQNVISITVSPVVTMNYTLTGADATCSNSILVTQYVSVCEGIQTLKNNESLFSVYPNPNTGEFNVDVQQAVTITVLNTLGSVILTQQLEEGKNTINLDKQAKGIYFVQAVYNNQVKTVRVAVQ